MRTDYIILILVLILNTGNSATAPTAGWIDECIEHTIHTRFEQALNLVSEQLTRNPKNYRAYFYRAATLSSKMTHFENDDGEQDFRAAIDSSITIIELLLEDSSGVSAQNRADYLFYLGSAYGYLAFYQGRTGSYFPALTNGLKSNSLLNLAVVTDSTLYDAYLGIGVFKYWRYSKLKFISWLPFIPDERDEGIEYIKKAIIHETRSKYMAMHQLVYILTDYGYPDQAKPFAEQIVAKYPDSQFMWWAAAKAYDQNDDFEHAVLAYEKLNQLIAKDQHANPNHLYKSYLKLAQIYLRKKDYQSCQNTCTYILNLLPGLSVVDREDKMDQMYDILNECRESSEQHARDTN